MGEIRVVRFDEKYDLVNSEEYKSFRTFRDSISDVCAIKFCVTQNLVSFVDSILSWNLGYDMGVLVTYDVCDIVHYRIRPDDLKKLILLWNDVLNFKDNLEVDIVLQRQVESKKNGHCLAY